MILVDFKEVSKSHISKIFFNISLLETDILKILRCIKAQDFERCVEPLKLCKFGFFLYSQNITTDTQHRIT
jgi:hypothetical protein